MVKRSKNMGTDFQGKNDGGTRYETGSHHHLRDDSK